LEADPATAPLAPIIQGVLAGIDPSAMGLSSATLSDGFNLFDNTPLGTIDAPISTISTEDVYEVGYKGFVAQKLGVTFDVYSVTQRNNSQFTAISPVYRLDSTNLNLIGPDLGVAVASDVGARLEDALIAAGVPDAAATAAQLLPLIQGAYTAGGAGFAGSIGALPYHATIPTEQSPDNGVTHIAAGYRTFDKRTFIGADLGLEYFISDDLSAFGNLSWVNRNDFMQNVVGVEGNPLPSYLNIPKFKYRLGVNYTPELGFRGNLSFQHDDSYFAAAGQYSGNTEPRNLVDAAVGYKFDFGLSIDLTATNVLDTQYRYLPNMPKIGRRFLAKLTYTIGDK